MAEKYGLEPREFEELVLRLMYDSLLDLKSKVPEDLFTGVELRKRLECLIKKIPRQNKNKTDYDRRRSGAKEVITSFHGDGDAVNNTPHKLEQETKGKRGTRRQIKLYNEIYHERMEELFKREKINDYTFTMGGRLQGMNGQDLTHNEFLQVLVNKLIKSRFKEFSTTKRRVSITPDEQKGHYDSILNLALSIVLGRAFTEMAIMNDLTDERDRTNWRNHVDVIAHFALYAIIIDGIHHRRWGTCGIDNYEHPT